jgi:hypothetical protein
VYNQRASIALCFAPMQRLSMAYLYAPSAPVSQACPAVLVCKSVSDHVPPVAALLLLPCLSVLPVCHVPQR